MYECPICQLKPKSHSFDILKEDNNQIIYYSCPSESLTPHDHNGIINHYKGFLESKGNKKWIWLIDGKGFKTSHINVQINMSLIKLLDAHESMLSKIIIFNSSKTLQNAVALAWPFVSTKMKKKICVDNKFNINQLNNQYHYDCNSACSSVSESCM